MIAWVLAALACGGDDTPPAASPPPPQDGPPSAAGPPPPSHGAPAGGPPDDGPPDIGPATGRPPGATPEMTDLAPTGDPWADPRATFRNLRTGRTQAVARPAPAPVAAKQLAVVGTIEDIHFAGVSWDVTSPVFQDHAAFTLSLFPADAAPAPWERFAPEGGCRAFGTGTALPRAEVADAALRWQGPGEDLPLVHGDAAGAFFLARPPQTPGLHGGGLVLTLDGERHTLPAPNLPGSFLVTAPYFQVDDPEQTIPLAVGQPMRLGRGGGFDLAIVVVGLEGESGRWEQGFACVQRAADRSGAPMELAVDWSLADGWPDGAPAHVVVGEATRLQTRVDDIAVDLLSIFWLAGLVEVERE